MDIASSQKAVFAVAKSSLLKMFIGQKKCKMFANNASTATTVLLAVLKQHIENLTGQQEP